MMYYYQTCSLFLYGNLIKCFNMNYDDFTKERELYLVCI